MANTPTSYGSTSQTTSGGQASSETPDIKSDATALMDEAKTTARKVADEAKDQAAGLAKMAQAELGEATEKVRGLAADQKDLIAAQVGGVADAMSRAASDLEMNNGASAHYARLIADNAEKLSTTIRENNVDDLLGIAQDFGRRQPVAFMGVAALLGFAASRFVMASAQRRSEAQYSMGSPGGMSGDSSTQYATGAGSAAGPASATGSTGSTGASGSSVGQGTTGANGAVGGY